MDVPELNRNGAGATLCKEMGCEVDGLGTNGIFGVHVAPVATGVIAEGVRAQDAARVRVMSAEPVFLEDKPKQRGRPTKFTRIIAERIYLLAARGFTEEEICDLLDIAVSTFNGWKRSGTFYIFLKRAKMVVDEEIEKSLLRLAQGGWLNERRTYYAGDGRRTKTVGIEREVLPDFHAARFWLMNRCPERWRAPVIADPEGAHVRDKPYQLDWLELMRS